VGIIWEVGKEGAGGRIPKVMGNGKNRGKLCNICNGKRAERQESMKRGNQD